MEGWIKLHRKIIESSVFKNHNAFRVWIWCLLKATHTPKKFSFGDKDIELSPGQFITGRKKAAEEIGISEQTYRTVIKLLISCHRLTTKKTNKFSLITIINWSQYQLDNHLFNQQLTNNQPTTNHNQECKEQKNERIDRMPVDKFLKIDRGVEHIGQIIQRQYGS